MKWDGPSTTDIGKVKLAEIGALTEKDESLKHYFCEYSEFSRLSRINLQELFNIEKMG